jgi:hypothetical protein
MNITLSADEAVIRKAREFAKRHNSSLNTLIRDYLEHLVNETDSVSSAEEFERLSTEFAGRSPAGYSFSREDIYSRVRSGK